MLVGCGLLCACNPWGGSDVSIGDAAPNSTSEIEDSGVDPSKNPFDAFSELAKVGKEMQEKAKEMADRKPVEPIHFRVLLALLPSPNGWLPKSDAKGETSQAAGFQISTASQLFTQGQGAAQKSMKVTLVDGSYVPMVYAPFALMSKFSRESTEGHSKGLKIDNQPAFEEWKAKGGKLKLTLLVEDRFLVTFEGKNVGPDEARKWTSYVDLKKLIEWGEKQTPGAALGGAAAPADDQPAP